jgi:ABC-2 type transport system ATP-binding protein
LRDVLLVDAVSKRFGATQALDEVSLAVPRGRIVGFLGPNGSGKTTTMRAIMGLVSIDGGTVTWRGEPITDDVRHDFGYMPAERGMYPKMRVREQLVYFARLAGSARTDAERAADHWLERMSLAERADDEVQALSSGNQQRLQLAISLVHEPDLLVLDEPFSGLDPVAVETMKALLIEEVDRGVTVLLSSHQLDLVSDVCRDVVIVDRGRVVLEGAVDDIRRRAPVRHVAATVASGDVAAFRPPHPSWEVVERTDQTLRLRVPSDCDADEVFAAVAAVGPIVEFEFAAPELSEVFIESVGRDGRMAGP